MKEPKFLKSKITNNWYVVLDYEERDGTIIAKKKIKIPSDAINEMIYDFLLMAAGYEFEVEDKETGKKVRVRVEEVSRYAKV